MVQIVEEEELDGCGGKDPDYQEDGGDVVGEEVEDLTIPDIVLLHRIYYYYEVEDLAGQQRRRQVVDQVNGPHIGVGH